jgi:hypothetical protein
MCLIVVLFLLLQEFNLGLKSIFYSVHGITGLGSMCTKSSLAPTALRRTKQKAKASPCSDYTQKKRTGAKKLAIAIEKSPARPPQENHVRRGVLKIDQNLQDLCSDLVKLDTFLR